MDPELIEWRMVPAWWLGSAALALLAAYTMLDLARGVVSARTGPSRRALVGASLALAVGLCAAHVLAATGHGLPFTLHHHGVGAIAVFAVAAGVGGVGLRLAADRRRRPMRLGAAAAVFTVLLCGVPMGFLVAADLHAPLHWQPGPWLAGIPGLFALLALALFLFSRGGRPLAPRTLAWQAAASVVLAGAIVAANALVTQWVAMPWDTVSPGAEGTVSLDTLAVLSTLSAPLLLALLLLTSVLEARHKAALRVARDALQVAAQTDPLTGLPNRAMFETWLLRATARAERERRRVSLLFVNVDGLKTVNESLGQAAGDAVLREMGRRLRTLALAREAVARAGGDEFLVMLDGDPAPEAAAALAERLQRRLQDPFVVDARELPLSCSIGVASFPEHGGSKQLIPHAAAAMHAAKRNGRGTVATFDARMVAGVRDQVELLRDLRRAIQQGELSLHYQPKVHAPSGQVTGAEALMRWQHPQRGMVGPHIFIPLAERFGLIHALGNWLIEESCRQVRAWRSDGLRMRVAINLSVHQLRQEDLVDRVVDALARHRVEPGQLTCEITESAAMEDTRTTLQVIERLSAAGVHLSIDDFGTGHSSLSYLRQLKAEELKIDRSFVMDLETSADARAIVDAVVKLAQALGLKVVAEGVETEAQQAILRALGCDELQGYLYAKPMPAEALAIWALRQEGPRALDFRASLFGDTLTTPP